MFEDTEYNYDTLHTRMREEAFLNAGLRIRTVDTRPGQEQEDNMCYEGGIREFVTWLNQQQGCAPQRRDLHVRRPGGLRGGSGHAVQRRL